VDAADILGLLRTLEPGTERFVEKWVARVTFVLLPTFETPKTEGGNCVQNYTTHFMDVNIFDVTMYQSERDDEASDRRTIWNALNAFGTGSALAVWKVPPQGKVIIGGYAFEYVVAQMTYANPTRSEIFVSSRYIKKGSYSDFTHTRILCKCPCESAECKNVINNPPPINPKDGSPSGFEFVTGKVELTQSVNSIPFQNDQ